MKTNEILKNIKNSKKIAIFSHKNPDPDAYGSAFTVKEICKSLKIKAEIFAIKNATGYLDEIFPLNELQVEFKAKDYDLIILTDLHVLSRLEPCFLSEVEKCKNIIVIDHHKILETEKNIDGILLIESNKSATCEVLTDFLIQNNIEISSTVATYLWTGLVGDTDRFLHKNLSENVLEIAKVLYRSGANVQFVYDNLYRKMSFKHLKLQQVFINKLNLIENGKACYVVFTINEMRKLGIDRSDVKMFVGDMIKIDGVQVSVLCLEYSKNHYKFSLRSNNINTLPLSAKFGGGGHEGASGFELDIKRKQIVQTLPVWIKELLNG